TITVSPMNGFTGSVSLSAMVSPATGLTCTLLPTSLTLGASGSSTLSCSGSAGTYVVTVTGSSSGLSHSATVTYSTQDFTLTANPSSVTVSASTPGTSTITVGGLNGFAGVVNLGTNSTSCGVSPTSVTGSGTANLSCNFATSNTVHVGVTGTSGSLSHTVTLTFAVQDFSLVANPTSVTVNAGTVGTSTITVTGLNGFAGVVNLSSNSTACTITPSSLTGSGSSSLSCNFSSASTNTVLVSGASGSLTHTNTVTFTVQDFTIADN